MSVHSNSQDFANSAEKKPVFIGRGRISPSTVEILNDDVIKERIAKKFDRLDVINKRPVYVWDPHISRFIDTTPDIRGGFTKASHDPKFSGRKIQTPEEIEQTIRKFPGAHFVIPFAISGENLGERFMQLTDLCELIATESKGDYTLDIILPKPFGDRNDKDHKRNGFKLYNAKTISAMSRILKESYNVKRFYVCEPHSFNAMRLVRNFFDGDAYFPSFAPALGKKTMEYLEKTGLGTKFTMDDVAILAPDGGLKHLIGSARYLAYMTAKGYDVPTPMIYKKEPFMQINAAYYDSLDYYRKNQDAPFDYDRNDGPQASIERAWKTYLFLKGHPTTLAVPMLLEDFPDDFLLFDKQRQNDRIIDKLVLIHGTAKNKILLSIDDISATGRTQVACALEAYKKRARNFIPVLMHGGFVDFISEEDKKEFGGTDNGLHYMLTRKKSEESQEPLFPVVMFSNSAPSAEDYKEKLLPKYPEFHDRVELIDAAEVTAECAIDAMLEEQYGQHNPDLVLMTLPEVALHEKYTHTLKNVAEAQLTFNI